MKINILLIVATVFLLSACATTSGPSEPQIKRITPEELSKLIPAAVASYPLEQVVMDSKQSKSPTEIIAKIKASDSRYDLTASKILELNKQGVDEQVLSYIQQSNELAKQNYLAEEINKVEREKAEALRKLNQQRQMQRQYYYDPFWDPFWSPYGYPYYRRGFGFGGYPFRRF